MEKINLVGLLKDCPKGMELDCTMFEGIEFDRIVDNERLPIRCRIKHPDGGYHIYNFTKYGCWADSIFPNVSSSQKVRILGKDLNRLVSLRMEIELD